MEIFKHYEHLKLTQDQQDAVKKINDFLNGNEKVFLLQGYAGSGKTTLLKGLVKFLKTKGQKFQLMAPTGRAAKVINEKTGFEATTIHKGIYNFDELKEIEKGEDENDLSFLYQFALRVNNESNIVYLVDESSMLSDVLSEGEFFRFGSGFLLRDLLTHGKILSPELRSKVIFVGDPAQLPPVGMNFSPALDEEYLKKTYDLSIVSCQITEVKRQGANNGVLKSASKIRKCLTSGFYNDFDLRADNVDLFNPDYEDYLETYKSAKGQKIIICFKNKTAYNLNKTVRINKFGSDLPIQPTDTVIIGQNNYPLNILNGEFGIVSEVSRQTESRPIAFNKKGGDKAAIILTWRKLSIVIPDEKGQTRIVSGLMLENYLLGDAYLSPDEQRALYVDFRNRNRKLKPNTEAFKEAITNDLYFNCIQLKYGYAVTCHKAQGGEWNNAFVFWDKGVQPKFNFYEAEQNRSGKSNPDFYRWAYTAITRGSDKLYCINPPYFNSFTGLSLISKEVEQAQSHLMGDKIEENIVKFNDYASELNRHNLSDKPVSIQDHFISTAELIKPLGISIKSWDRVSYEIRYVFEQGDKTAAFKFWVNGRDIFKTNYVKLPSCTNSDELFNKIDIILKKRKEVIVERASIEVALKKIKFDYSIEEKKPFLKTLFDRVSDRLENGLEVTDLKHLEYRERYTFSRNLKSLDVDFEYNKDGFFGRVLSVGKENNKNPLTLEVMKLVNKLKH